MHEASHWKVKFSSQLHVNAKAQMQNLVDYIKTTNGQLQREVTDLDTLAYMMDKLKEIRERESGVEMEISPILEIYGLLENFVDHIDKEEMDQKSVLRSSWTKLVDYAERVTDNLTAIQLTYRRKLLKDIKMFKVEVVNFKNAYDKDGPGVPRIAPKEAVERLKTFQERFNIHWRKYEGLAKGESLFAMAPKKYKELEDVKKDIGNLTKLYSLYTDVINQKQTWSPTLWDEIGSRTEEMTSILAGYYNRCITMQPRKLRERDAYIELKKEIEDLQTVLPLLEQLGKPSIKPRHWTEVIKISNADFTPGPELTLQDLLDAHLEDYKDDIEDITEGADKQLGIETKLGEIKDRWLIEEFQFMDYPKHSPPLFILMGVPRLMEDLDEAQMNLQTLLTMKHVTPFREEVQSKLTQLSDTQETLDRWLKVQLM